MSGWLAHFSRRETVFLLGLVIPAISALGVLLIRSESSERRPIDWRILGGGGIGFGVILLAVTLGGLPFAQEIIFFLSMFVICTILFFVTRELDASTRRAILFTSIIIFTFRATLSVGDGYLWVKAVPDRDFWRSISARGKAEAAAAQAGSWLHLPKGNPEYESAHMLP